MTIFNTQTLFESTFFKPTPCWQTLKGKIHKFFVGLNAGHREEFVFHPDFSSPTLDFNIFCVGTFNSCSLHTRFWTVRGCSQSLHPVCQHLSNGDRKPHPITAAHSGITSQLVWPDYIQLWHISGMNTVENMGTDEPPCFVEYISSESKGKRVITDIGIRWSCPADWTHFSEFGSWKFQIRSII